MARRLTLKQHLEDAELRVQRAERRLGSGEACEPSRRNWTRSVISSRPDNLTTPAASAAC
jgi:hypothetical protein